MNTKDVIHIATAVAAARNNECNFFITSDGDLHKEATNLVKEIKLQNRLKVLKPKDFVEKYPPIKKVVVRSRSGQK